VRHLGQRVALRLLADADGVERGVERARHLRHLVVRPAVAREARVARIDGHGLRGEVGEGAQRAAEERQRGGSGEQRDHGARRPQAGAEGAPRRVRLGDVEGHPDGADLEPGGEEPTRAPDELGAVRPRQPERRAGEGERGLPVGGQDDLAAGRNELQPDAARTLVHEVLAERAAPQQRLHAEQVALEEVFELPALAPAEALVGPPGAPRQRRHDGADDDEAEPGPQPARERGAGCVRLTAPCTPCPAPSGSRRRRRAT
jgi:hypothetical protein